MQHLMKMTIDSVSCIPWIDFSHFAVHYFDNKSYYFPSVEAGRIYRENGKEKMPLSITCHHAAFNQVGEYLQKLTEIA